MLKNIYNQKITILNKLNRVDSLTGLDVWYKTVIDDAAWYKSVERGVTTTSVVISPFIKVEIPFHDNFLPYDEWKQNGMQVGNYTMSANDYIVLGEVEEDINAQNVVATMKKYGENVCTVKFHKELYNRFNANVQIYVEGV